MRSSTAPPPGGQCRVNRLAWRAAYGPHALHLGRAIQHLICLRKRDGAIALRLAGQRRIRILRPIVQSELDAQGRDPATFAAPAPVKRPSARFDRPRRKFAPPDRSWMAAPSAAFAFDATYRNPDAASAAKTNATRARDSLNECPAMTFLFTTFIYAQQRTRPAGPFATQNPSRSRHGRLTGLGERRVRQ